ncbi:uncharacterized protein LOC118180380 [Stegodyphus dumicola]|uniref:uncharacterized protein LOC118180380 n=1 Tax=Stegodyphus dumicola TaxID=202533 RepID=UPI0015AC4B12|nr:uncharacterized protein LOC118180380 [Stegodyphus dumicola]
MAKRCEICRQPLTYEDEKEAKKEDGSEREVHAIPNTTHDKKEKEEECYAKTAIKPWPMPCTDGTKVIALPPRNSLRKTVQVLPPVTKIKEDSVNPYILEKKQPVLLLSNYGFPPYKIVNRPHTTKLVMTQDKQGNPFRLTPGPRYNPFS